MNCRTTRPSELVSRIAGQNLFNPDVDICYDPTLITKLKTSHIRIISAFFAEPTITADVGKVLANFSLRMATKKAGPLLTLP
jgi:hypothetical protein